MPKLLKETVTLSLRLREDLIEKIENRIENDPLFVSKSEFIAYSVKKTYVDIMVAIQKEINRLCELRGKDMDQDLFDQIVENRMTLVALLTGRSLMIFDTFEKEYEVLQIRLPKSMMPLIDTVCYLAAIRRVDFIKHAIINETIMFDAFYLDSEGVYYVNKGKHAIPMQYTGRDWQFSMRMRVIESLAEKKLTKDSQES